MAKSFLLLMFLLLSANLFAQDLIPTSLSMDGPDIALTIFNTSYGTTANGHYASIVANGKSQNVYVSAIGPRASRIVKTTASYFGSGIATVQGFVDSLGWISEGTTGESNNVITSSLDLAGSVALTNSVDLIVEDIRDSDPYFWVRVRNMGGSGSSAYSYLRVCLNGTCLLNYIATPAAGSSSEVAYNKSQFYVTNGGSYLISATADYYNYIAENSESNNSWSESIYFSPAVALGDLTVTDIQYVNGGIDVTVKNQGQTSVPPSFSAKLSNLSNGYSMSRSGVLPNYNILPGSSAKISFLLSDVGVQLGQTVTLQATADSSYIISESIESNNILSKSVVFAAALPDLIVEDILVDGTDLKVKVKNQGLSASNSSFYTYVTLNGYSYYLYYSGSIAAGSSIFVTRPVSSFYLSSGVSYTATARVDSDYYVTESNENNNSLSKSVLIGSASGSVDLVVQSVTRYVYGDFVYALVVIKNQGSGNFANGMNNQIRFGVGGYYVSWTSTSLAVPAPGGTFTDYMYLGYTSQYPAGSLQIELTLDYDQRIPELSESNNVWVQTGF